MKEEKIRKVFLENLPRKEGIRALKGKEVIDWTNCCGRKVKFVYDELDGEVEILDYSLKKQILTIKYLNKISTIHKSSFIMGKLGKVLGVYTSDFKFEIGQSFKDEKRDLTITDREYRKDKKDNQKWYKYTCNKCGWTEGWIIEGHLKAGNGCPVCCPNPQKVVLGINTIYDTDPWMMNYGISEEDAKKYTRCSNKIIEVQCPSCKTKRKARVNDIYRKKYTCRICSDGYSYPEKIMVCILKQLEVDFIPQLTKVVFDWCERKKYDFYIPSLNMIIETHGMQHYEQQGRKSARTLEEEQENDREKRELALNNGINKYIVIDCRYSELNYIKKSIINSELNSLFDLNKVNWVECENYSLSSLIKEICEYWNNKEEWETIGTIFENNPWGIKSRGCIRTYLIKGNELGWCIYDGKEELRKSNVRKGKLSGNKVELFKNGISFGVFESIAELERQSEERFGVKLWHNLISETCNNKRDNYKGFTFKYI